MAKVLGTRPTKGLGSLQGVGGNLTPSSGQRQKTTRVTSEGPVLHQHPWLFRTLKLCHLGKVEHLCHTVVRRGLSTGVSLRVSPGELQ